MNDRKNDDFHNLRFMLLINNTVIHIHSVEEVQREREKKPLKGFKLQITVRYRDKINLANNSKDRSKHIQVSLLVFGLMIHAMLLVFIYVFFALYAIILKHT